MIRKLGKDVMIYGGADLVFKLVAFSVFPIYAHVFSVEQFGILALLTVSASLIGVFINLGVNNAVQRFYWDPATEKAGQPVIVSTGLLQLMISGIIVLLILAGISYFNRDLIFQRYAIEWGLIAMVLATVLPEQLIQYSMDTVRLHFKPVRFMLISFTKNLFGVFIGLFFILVLNKGLYGLFAGPLIGALIALPLALWYIRKELTLSVDKKVFRQLFHFGAPFVFTGIAYWVFGSLDRWMLAEMSTLAQVGLYSIAFKFAAVVGFATTAFAQAWSPYAVKLMREDQEYKKTYSRLFSLWFFGIALLGLTISLFAGEALYLLTPESYWPAAGLMSVVVAGAVVFSTTQFTAIGISLVKKTRVLTFGATIAAITNLLLNFLLIPRFGAIGAASATVLANATLTLCFLYSAQRLHPIPLEKNKLIYGCFMIFAAIALSLLLNRHPEISLLLIAIKIAIILMMIIGGFTVGIIDRRMFSSFIIRNHAKSSYYRS